MRLLVTGGAGFIGSNFVRYWLRDNPKDQVAVLDKFTYAGHIESLREFRKDKRLLVVKGDICDYEIVRWSMKNVDAVVHFAAESHVDRSLSGLEGELNFYRTNIGGTVTLLHAARDLKVPKFHLVSTDEVFGDLPYDTAEKFRETTPYKPHSPYAVSKAAADFAARAHYRSYGTPVTISNCTNNYGPYMIPEKMIPRSISLLLQGDKVKLYTDSEEIPGRNVRDWLYVEDHCSAINLILRRGKIGETYCVGGESELTNYELIKKLLQIMSEETGQKYGTDTHVEFVADRPGHDRRYAVDITKIRTELGWRPTLKFEDGLRQTVRWYLSSEGREWLELCKEASHEVREGQDELQTFSYERKEVRR